MSDLKTKIEEIKTYINDLCVFTHFGGLCYLETKDGVTYGISTEPDCNGNLYGNNHNELSGFLHISNMGNRTLNNQINQSVVNVDLHMFVPHKIIGESQKYYYVINHVFSRLQSKFWQKYTITFNGNLLNKYKDVEYGIITIQIPYFNGCEELIKGNEVC